MDCDICFSKMRLPYIFICGHSFCITCITQYFKVQYYVCPICRKNITHVLPNYSLRKQLGEIDMPISNDEADSINFISSLVDDNNLIIKNKCNQRIIYLVPYDDDDNDYDLGYIIADNDNINIIRVVIGYIIIIFTIGFVLSLYIIY